MVKRNVMIFDLCMRLLLALLQASVNFLCLWAWCALQGTKVFGTWLILMVVDKLGIIAIFSAYNFKDALRGLCLCGLCYGTAWFLKMFLHDECLYHLECQADNILRNMIKQKI